MSKVNSLYCVVRISSRRTSQFLQIDCSLHLKRNKFVFLTYSVNSWGFVWTPSWNKDSGCATSLLSGEAGQVLVLNPNPSLGNKNCTQQWKNKNMQSSRFLYFCVPCSAHNRKLFAFPFPWVTHNRAHRVTRCSSFLSKKLCISWFKVEIASHIVLLSKIASSILFI